MKMKYKYYVDGQIFMREIYWPDGSLESIWYRYEPTDSWNLAQ